MRVRLAYGTHGLPLEVPDRHPRLSVLRQAKVPALPDPERAVRAAVEQPTATPPLVELARGRHDAVVVISDITRPVPNRRILPPLLATLEEGGIPREAITILIATGMHRPNEGEELLQLVGPEIARQYRTLNHLSREPAELRDIGSAGNGIPLHINRHYLDADLKILTGFIEPHLWAGYSGGVKAILPGIAGPETMRHMHGYAMVDHPLCCYGQVHGNPFREAGWEVAQRTGVDFILNVTLNEAKEITGVFAGHPLEAHAAGVAFLEPSVVREVAEPVDVAITTSGGDPLDRTLYQTIKGMSGVAPILADGGRMVIASACHEGAGGPEFSALLDEAESPAALLARLREPGFFRRDQWAAQEIASLLTRHPARLKTEGLPPARVRDFFFEPVEDVQAELDGALAEGARVALVPDGPYVIARAP